MITNGLICRFDDAGNIEWLSMPQMSNWHAHLRTGLLGLGIGPETMRPWKYLVVMPNTGPIDTIDKMDGYRKKLIGIRDRAELKTEFIMTIYFTEKLTPDVVKQMAKLPFHSAVKYYPPHAGATTGSGLGIPLTDARAKETLRAMETHGIRLLGHFESVFDIHGNELPQEQREDYFMEHEFMPLREAYPNLHITIEHATTAAAIRRVRDDSTGKTICGITPQAMLLVRKDLDSLSWGVHAKCMPIAKTPEDRDAVREFALSGDFRAHLGDDTAAHPSKSKLVPFAHATSGCYLPHSPALYVDIFHKYDALPNLVKFACDNGAHSWGLPTPERGALEAITFRGKPSVLHPTLIPDTEDVVIPFGLSVEGDGITPSVTLE